MTRQILFALDRTRKTATAGLALIGALFMLGAFGNGSPLRSTADRLMLTPFRQYEQTCTDRGIMVDLRVPKAPSNW